MVGWSFFVPWPLRPLLAASSTARKGESTLAPSSLMSLSSLQPPTIGLKLLHAGDNPVFEYDFSFRSPSYLLCTLISRQVLLILFT